MSTSGVDRTDLNPEDAYDVDLRRIDPEERNSLRKGGINSQQGRVEKEGGRPRALVATDRVLL